MAMVKLGSPLAGIAGSSGGTIFKRDGFCLHALAKTRQVKRDPSTSQKTRRSAFSTLYHYWWKRKFGPFHRNLWTNSALTHPVPNKLGEPIILTGFAYFARLNINRLIDTGVILYEPPVGTPIDP